MKLPKTDQQLLSLAWAEQHESGARGKIMTHTYSLLHRGLVQRHADGLTVTLTPTGRARAEHLAGTPEGQAYMAWAQQEDTDGTTYEQAKAPEEHP